MATLDNRYKINGLINTSNPVMQNMETITNSCNTWLSYDALEGKWAVVINRAGTAQFAFNDNNIIGPINLTTTELTGFYNSCEVRFHNIDLRDKEDFVVLEIPANQRLPNEPDNRLIINAPMVNNQIQAELLGLIELKQSRLDKVIEFTTDFSYVNIEAGTIISVTNPVYGWTNKLFRVLTMTEQQDNDTIVIQIRAQEYDSAIYDDSDLYEYLRTTETGLIELDPLVDVSPVTASTAVIDPSTGGISPLLVALPLLLSLLDGLNAGDPNELYEGIFNALYDDTGTNLISGAPAAIVAELGTLTANVTQSSTPTQYKLIGQNNFTAPITGRYQVVVYFDQNSSGAIGGRGSEWGEVEDKIGVAAQIFDLTTGGPSIYVETSGGRGAFFWNDFVVNNNVNLVEGHLYQMQFEAINYTQSYPTDSANFTVGWQVINAGT